MNEQYQQLSADYSDKDRSYYEMERSELLPFVPENVGSVLDVGCSSGAFGSLVKRERAGAEVWGVEPDGLSAELASKRLDRVINGTFSSELPELAGREFDLICFNDVLEHLVDPAEALRLARTKLSARGCLLASIPNILHFYQIGEILLHQDWRYREEGILDSTHLRFFTRKSILRMFTEAEFTRVLTYGINPFTDFRFHLANVLLLGRISDWKYIQFAVQAWK